MAERAAIDRILAGTLEKNEPRKLLGCRGSLNINSGDFSTALGRNLEADSFPARLH